MSEPFLKLVANHIFEHHKDTVEKLCIVLPNKRGAIFLKNHLAQTFNKTMWLPQIISIEDLLEELSGLKTMEEIDLLCHLYESYRFCYGAKSETFDAFVKWGHLILQDFNEIDRCLANPAQLYENLKDIKVIENWSLGQEPLSDYQLAYLQFMGSLGAIYRHYTSFMLSKGWAYQGMAYREAVKKLEDPDFGNKFYRILFCGFNALNPAELRIFNRFVKQNKAELLWDADEYYLKDSKQEAGVFMRINLETFARKEPQFIGQHFKGIKNIRVISVPKQTGQAQVVKQCLEELMLQQVSTDKIAVVLANEKLLWPVLQQLPPAIKSVNVTMEYPLRFSSAYALTELLLQVQLSFSKQKKINKTIYHKDLVALLRQPLFQHYLKANNAELNTHLVIQEITRRNLSFINTGTLRQLFGTAYSAVSPFTEQAVSVDQLNSHFISLHDTLINYFDEQENTGAGKNLELEYLQVILKNFNRLSEILYQYTTFNDLASYRQLFAQILGNATVPFIGEPLSGLQIMGVLETRTLDFEHVIFVNVNEGVIPSGKGSHSFIPNDLKKAFGLPLYSDKDAIYAYHFYRLLQRAKNIIITHDSETDSFGKGEKSRFVTQLQLELKKYNPLISFTQEVATYNQLPANASSAIEINKSTEAISPILEKAVSTEDWGGLSPSGLITFKECSLKFYFRYGARLIETEEVEESAEAGTFGSILHLSLEELYKDFTGRVISTNHLKQQLSKAEAIVHKSFISFFDNEKPSGKNLLQEEVIKVYVKKLIGMDIRLVEQLAQENKHLTLGGLEKEFNASLEVMAGNKKQVVIIKGKIDRLDNWGGYVRIIDYKSSLKDSDKFTFDGFEKLFNDKNYNKQFQLLLYAWLLHKNKYCAPDKMLPGIIPFKVFADEPRFILAENKQVIELSEEFMVEFEKELSAFVASILDEETAFTQTEDLKICEYCAYNPICSREPY